MIIGRPPSFAIEYILAHAEFSESISREYLPIYLRYWINNEAIGDINIPCYLGDLVQELAEIVRDNGTRDGYELCFMNKYMQIEKIYQEIYGDLESTTLDMPAKYNIIPSLPPFGDWFIFAIKCGNQVILIYSEFPFARVERHAIYEHDLNGVLRLTFNNMSEILEGLRGFGDAECSDRSSAQPLINEGD